MVAADALRSLCREWTSALAAPSHQPLFKEHRPGEPMRNILRDFGLAARVLAKSPGFTIASVLTLALGIGANSAMFTLADATLLRPLNVRSPESLVVWSWSGSYPDYKNTPTRTDIFDGVLAVGGIFRVNLAEDNQADLAWATFVSGNRSMFSVSRQRTAERCCRPMTSRTGRSWRCSDTTTGEPGSAATLRLLAARCVSMDEHSRSLVSPRKTFAARPCSRPHPLLPTAVPRRSARDSSETSIRSPPATTSG